MHHVSPRGALRERSRVRRTVSDDGSDQPRHAVPSLVLARGRTRRRGRTVRLLPRSPWLWHALAVGVALWSMSALVKYRVLGWSLVAYLPWVGCALVLLNVMLLVRQFIGPSPDEGTIRDVVRRIDRGARLLIVAFAYWALFVVFNAGLDRSPRTLWYAQVVEVGGRTVSAGLPLIYSSA